MFGEILDSIKWEDVTNNIISYTKDDVEKALSKNECSIEDFQALLSPAAAPYLEEMCKKSQALTQQRFGKIIQLYIPLYLSNECNNHCLYCGFSKTNNIKRKVLSKEEILSEVRIIKEWGYEHVLLVTGESHSKAGLDYLKEAIEIVKPYFSQISIEVQPLDEDEYKMLLEPGLHTVYVYQETYNRQRYNHYHPKGKKADFDYRLETPERIGESGVFRIGIGNLLGLENWRTEAYFTALHLKYLEKKYWKTKYSISFPRLRPHKGAYNPENPVSDRELIQLIAAYRIFDNEVELSISVRESEVFRNNVMKLGITSMSAGSRTEPGGYSLKSDSLEQFEVHDNRSPEEIAKMIQKQGYDPVWKDWDGCLH